MTADPRSTLGKAMPCDGDAVMGASPWSAHGGGGDIHRSKHLSKKRAKLGPGVTTRKVFGAWARLVRRGFPPVVQRNVSDSTLNIPN
jgi:hypothetical protein